MPNGVDPDQLASSEANWSGFTLLAKAAYQSAAVLGLIGFSVWFPIERTIPIDSVCSCWRIWLYNEIYSGFLNLYHSLGYFSRQQIRIFPRKQDLTFHANCLHWTICMKYQNLFSRKNKKNVSICPLLKILYRRLNINFIFFLPRLNKVHGEILYYPHRRHPQMLKFGGRSWRCYYFFSV